MKEGTNALKLRVLVESSPGIHLREAQRVLGVSFTTVRHHVRRLLEDKAIVSRRYGRYNRLFPQGFPDSEIGQALAVRNRTTKLIIEEIAIGHKRSNKSVSRSTGLAKSTVSRHIRLLESLGVVERTNSNTGLGFNVNERLAFQLLNHGRSGLRTTVDRYIALWNRLD
ncbi:MAG TPA: winged helix-turn-helix transcriptional regulator [Nitrososphaerales archaeon]